MKKKIIGSPHSKPWTKKDYLMYNKHIGWELFDNITGFIGLFAVIVLLICKLLNLC